MMFKNSFKKLLYILGIYIFVFINKIILSTYIKPDCRAQPAAHAQYE